MSLSISQPEKELTTPGPEVLVRGQGVGRGEGLSYPETTPRYPLVKTPPRFGVRRPLSYGFSVTTGSL